MTSDDAPTAWALPPPEPYQGATRCPRCTGAKIIGYRLFDTVGPRHLIVDEVCPTCKGCGRADHDQCQPGDHPIDDHPNGPDDHDADDADDAEPAEVCRSCHGRRYWICQGYGTSDARPTVHHLRVPCGCATDLLVQVVDGQMILAPVCPECGKPPMDTPTLLPAGQAFCQTPGCPVMTWDLFDDPAGFAGRATQIDLTALDRLLPPEPQ